MVAARRIKQLVQLSAIGLVLLTFLIFVQWEDVSSGTRLKRQYVDLQDDELATLDHELDVHRILKEIQENVSIQLQKKEHVSNQRRQLVHNVSESQTNTNSVHFPASKTTVSSGKSLKNRKASRERAHRHHLKKFQWKTEKWGPHMLGQLNVHVWQGWCGNTIHDLRRNWFFPLYPDLRLSVGRLYVKHYESDYGQRIFGYLHPPLTGKYVFAVSSDDTSEFWLSTDEHPENVQLIAWVCNKTSYGGNYRTVIGEFTKYNSQLSRQVYLKKGQKYFMEALHKQGARADHILVGWKIPGLPGFRYITGNSISMYIYDAKASPDVTEYVGFIPQTLASHTHSHNWSVVLDREVHKFGTHDGPEVDHHRTRPPFLNFDNLFYNCRYEPSYLVKNFTLRRYEGVGLIHDSSVYPDDHTALSHMRPFDKCGYHRRFFDSHGNHLNINNKTAFSNRSLYEEGSINVFGLDGEGSIVTTSSDLSESYPSDDEHSEKVKSSSDNVRSLQDRIRIVDDVYGDANNSRQDALPIHTVKSNDPRNSLLGNNDSNNNQRNRVQFDPRNMDHPNVIHSDPGYGNQGDVRSRSEETPGNGHHRDTPKRKRSRHRGVILNLAKKMMNDRRVVYSDTEQGGDVRNIENHLQQAMLGGNHDNLQNTIVQNVNQDTKKGSEHVQNIGQDSESKPVHRESKQVNPGLKPVKQSNRDSNYPSQQDRDINPVKPVPKQVSKPEFQLIPNGRVTLRKLMSIQQEDQSKKGKTDPPGNDDDDEEEEEESDDGDDDDDDNDGGVQGMITAEFEDLDDDLEVDNFFDNEVSPEPTKAIKIGKDVIYFRRGIPFNNSVLSKDSVLARVYAAREYVRRMQKVVQIYKYDITSKQLSDQIYRRFGIRMKTPDLRFYTDYNPWLYHQNITKCGTDGNILLSENVAHSVVMRYMKSIDRVRPHQFKLEKILNVQENHDIIRGDRYLIELELFHYETNQKARVSQYVYQEIGYTDFCSPNNFHIHHHATVHVIIPVKNQGRWVQYFIDDMSELYVKTGDPHLNIIIVDFSSDDIDINEALRRSPLKRYRVITLTGPFQRAFGIQAGASVISNPNDIIFMCDLHLEIPNNMIDVIRKHCVQGRMAFAPIVLRLHCGFTPTIPYGFWELQGYGLFAMFKSDFDKVGGMNYREFGTRWGGEDWELLDRVLLHKMEVERLRVPNFYHFYHSKKGMWSSPTIDVIHSDIASQYYRNKNQIIPLYKPPKKRQEYTVNLDNTRNNRHLRTKRSRQPRVIRQSSRVRRGYVQPQKPKATDKNGAKIYY